MTGSVALSLALLGAACAQPAAPLSRPAQTVASPDERLQALIGDAACRTDAHCATVPVGAKACGGPERYVAWSRWRSDAEAIRAAAEDATRDAERRRVKDAMSTCSVVADPGATCVAAERATGDAPARRCRLGSGGGIGAAVR